MTMMILVGGIALFVIGVGVLIFTPAPQDSNNFQHLPGQSPIDKLLSDGKNANSEIQLPEVLNQADIVSKLYKLQNTPSVFDMYVMLLLNKFSADGQKRLILQEVTKFKAGQELINANIDFQRSLNELNRLSKEDKIINKQGEVQLAQLDADIAEAKLRKATLKEHRKQIKQPQSSNLAIPNPQFNTDDLVFGEKQRKLNELLRKKQSQEQKINSDPTLSAQDRKERLDLLELNYQQEKLKLQVGFGGFEDD